jgi:hypothetical protein
MKYQITANTDGCCWSTYPPNPKRPDRSKTSAMSTDSTSTPYHAPDASRILEEYEAVSLTLGLLHLRFRVRPAIQISAPLTEAQQPNLISHSIYGEYAFDRVDAKIKVAERKHSALSGMIRASVFRLQSTIYIE